MKRIILIIAFCLPFVAYSQIPLPTFDVAVKAGYTGEFLDYNSINYRLELNAHINQFVAVGGFYSRSIFGDVYSGDNFDLDYKLDQLMFGAKVRVSTGRISKFRPYGFLALMKFESVAEVNPGLNFAGDWTGVTFGAGLMIRLTDKLYLNLIEFEYIPVGGEYFFVSNNDNFIAVRFGANYTFGKRR